MNDLSLPAWSVPTRPVGQPAPDGPTPTFSVCTLVTNNTHYGRMLETFAARGFVPPRAEFLFVDNRAGNSYEAYAGLRRLVAESRGRYVIAVHQDVLLLEDGVETLEARLAELEARHPDWALAGNAGMRPNGRAIARITDPHEQDTRRGGPFPGAVVSLDENFIVIRRDTGVMPSGDLAGFHFYGLDLCLQARIAGYTAHVIDFHLHHLGRGTRDPGFFLCQAALEAKYSALLPTMVMRTTCATVLIGPQALRPAFGPLRWALTVFFRRWDRWLPA